MPFIEEEIQSSYANALNRAKNRQESSCCPPSTSCGCGCAPSVEAPVTNQSISFGCLLLETFLSEYVKPGMTVIDLGSGPGHDLMIAARYAGPEGRAIGVDFTDEMIVEAENAARKDGLTNVELVKASIEDIPLPDGIADIIISNCVINLASDKANVFKEAYRLLKPDGLLLDADVIAEKPLTDDIKSNKELWCSCVGGALTIEEHKQVLEEAGFTNIKIELGEKGLVTFENRELGILSGLVIARKLCS